MVEHAITDALLVYGLAIAVSLGAAALIRLMVALLSVADWLAARRAAPSAPAGPSVSAQDGLPEHHLVALAAAAHAMVGANRIVHIHSEPSHENWAASGRAAHHSSHHFGHHH